MWKKFKDNWKTYLLALLTAAVGWLGGDKALEYASTDTGAKYPRKEKPAPIPDNTWTVKTWIIANKETAGPGVPSVPYTDNLGLYVIKVQSPKTPTTAQIVEAFDKGLNAEFISLDILEIIPPRKQEETEQEKDLNKE